MFSSKKSEAAQPQFQTLYDPFASSRSKLNSYLTEKIGQKGPAFGGDRVAPLSDLEQKSIDKAGEYAAQPATTPTSGYAADEIKKTLSGDYDPSTSPYYQAVKAEAERNLTKTQENIADKAAGGGRFFSGARLKAQADAAADVNIGLNKQLGALAENERQNRLSVLPQALDLDEQQTNAPAKQAQALQVLGALPREQQQALLDAIYQEFLLSEYEYPLNIAQLASGPGQREPIFVQGGFTQPRAPLSSNILSLLSL